MILQQVIETQNREITQLKALLEAKQQELQGKEAEITECERLQKNFSTVLAELTTLLRKVREKGGVNAWKDCYREVRDLFDDPLPSGENPQGKDSLA
ncbi:MAG: hypothetical protein F6K36_29355 [Symploca sp. SIO3C6]|nr:hypothetical protein [Symploca sp. SIO3C6]